MFLNSGVWARYGQVWLGLGAQSGVKPGLTSNKKDGSHMAPGLLTLVLGFLAFSPKNEKTFPNTTV
jgi:hypothetical protein